MTNKGGLLVDENGIIRGIELPISDEPLTGVKRLARHDSLVIGADMQMVQRIRIVRMVDGVEMIQAIKDLDIPTSRQTFMACAYQDQTYAAATEGALVDNKTGLPTEGGKNAIEQLVFFQGITIGTLKELGNTVTNLTSVASMVYLLLLGEIKKLDAQGRL